MRPGFHACPMLVAIVILYHTIPSNNTRAGSYLHTPFSIVGYNSTWINLITKSIYFNLK